jgi:hypothetical protein
MKNIYAPKNVYAIFQIHSMNQKAEQLYETMLQDMEYCRRKGLGAGMELECLFHICTRYWAIIQSEAENYEFETTEEEVIFFKIMKPKFVSEKLYCGLIGNALLFTEGVQEQSEIKKFWDKELLRLEKFIAGNTAFYEYYKAGTTDKDNYWFTRKEDYGDDKVSTLQDNQVSMLLALERYTEYVKGEMKLAVIK